MNIKMKVENLKNILKKILLLSIVFFTSNLAYAIDECTYITFEGWKECFIENKISSNNAEPAKSIISKASLNDKVIDLDKKQPEKKMDFSRYLKIIDISGKVREGKIFLKANQSLLNEISRKYGVEPEVIVALVGIESHYGKRMGTFNIIDSLATLSYDGRRRDLFEGELVKALQMAEENSITYEDFIGSWAGALGQCQFMPSSYQAFAVDYDDDGKKDIWNSKADAFASTANYLNKSGWKRGLGHIKKYDKKDKKSQEIVKSTSKNCDIYQRPCKMGGDKYLISVDRNDIIASSYEVEPNFNVLLKWNRSYFFSLSVLMIADQIRQN